MDTETIMKLVEILLKESGSRAKTGDTGKGKRLDFFIGRNVLVRHNYFGVNSGVFDSYDDIGFVLKNSRKLWRWQAKEGIALESVAYFGVKEGTRMTAKNDCIFIPFEQLCGIIVISNLTVVDELYAFPVSEPS